MAWSSFTWTGDAAADSYQKHDDDFWNALNERRQVLAQGDVLVPEGDENIQTAQIAAPIDTGVDGLFSMRYIQDWIESNCESFVRSHNDNGTARSPNYYDGEETIDMWTFEDLMEAVSGGNGGTSFRATVGHPAPGGADDWTDAAFVERKALVNDTFGAWICQDIQQALNMLIWTLEGPAWDGGPAIGQPPRLDDTNNAGGGNDVDFDTAKDEAEAAWTSGNNLAYNQSPTDIQIASYTVLAGGGTTDAVLSWPGPGILAQEAYFKVAHPADIFAADVHWYLWAEEPHLPPVPIPPFIPSSAFAGNGHVPDNREDVYHHWSHEEGVIDDPVYSSQTFGSVGQIPLWANQAGAGEVKILGFHADGSLTQAIFVWSVTGGFDFVEA